MGSIEVLKKDALSLVDKGKSFIPRINASPDLEFQIDYQTWYSLSCRLIGRVLPERLHEFQFCYTDLSNSYSVSNYFMKRGSIYSSFQEEVKYYLDNFYRQLAVFAGVVTSIDSSLLDIREIVYYEYQEDELLAAKEIIKISSRAAGVIARVVIEKHLRKIVEEKHIEVKSGYEKPGLADYIIALRKVSIIQESEKKKLEYLKEIGNKCAHDKGVDPTQEEVNELIDGARWCISTIAV